MQVLIIQHIAGEGPGLLREVLEENDWKIDIRCMDKNGDSLPESLAPYHALIILGGFMSAYEDEAYPYLAQEQELVREAVEKQIPTLGICLGAQLIARALGAHVGQNPVKEIGWYLLHLTAAGRKTPLFAGLPLDFFVFQWHGDTFALPEEAILLAQGKTCLNQAFVYRGHIWALQFHLEVTPKMIEDWAGMYAEELVEFGGHTEMKNLMRKTKEKWEKMQPVREHFLRNIEKMLNPNK